MSEWTSVDKELPEYEDYVLLFDMYTVKIGYREGGRTDIFREKNNQLIHYVTHWMPLPEPPERIKESDDE